MDQIEEKSKQNFIYLDNLNKTIGLFGIRGVRKSEILFSQTNAKNRDNSNQNFCPTGNQHKPKPKPQPQTPTPTPNPTPQTPTPNPQP